jgi:hypothetical protein
LLGNLGPADTHTLATSAASSAISETATITATGIRIIPSAEEIARHEAFLDTIKDPIWRRPAA